MMFKFRPNVIFRFNLLVIFFFAVWGIVIMWSAVSKMTLMRDYWNIIKENNIGKESPEPPKRGKILSDNGELLVSTLPLYKIHLDFVYQNRNNRNDEEETNATRDSLWRSDLKKLSAGLHEIFPNKSAEEFEKDLGYGFRNKKRYHWLYNRKISYTQYRRLEKLPIMNMGKKYNGMIVEEEIERKNIFNDIGMSTFGIVRNTEKNGKPIEEINGLEKKYDSYLRGIPGTKRIEKVGGKKIKRVIVEPVNGMDIQTTINSDMLDICENAVKKVLAEHHLPAGWAILMETRTGDIKAVVNLTRLQNGAYYETTDNIPNNPTANHAFCRLMEPGSIFKTVALTAALDDGKISVRDSVYSYASREHTFNGKTVRDEMYRDNGTGKYSMAEALKYSSNISMVQYIRKAYAKNPKDYTDKLISMGLTQNYNLLESEATSYLTLPGTKSWNALSLNSMSYGYAVGMTGISMVTFYNTIANGGKQMQPRLVKAILKDGAVIEEFPTKVLNEQMISKSTAEDVTGLLVEVVNGKDGTGKRAKSSMMLVAGKTGTANIPNSITGRYDDSEKMMSFCGFFPADNPKYTLLVQMLYDKKQDTRPEEKKKKLGGGSSSAIAFKEIAEKIMAKELNAPLEAAVDTVNTRYPKVKSGNVIDAGDILKEFGISLSRNAEETKEKYVWGEINADNNGEASFKAKNLDIETVPDVSGMGAKDAIYLMQERGLNVQLEGYGKVKEQSIAPGTKANKGERVRLVLADTIE